MASKPKTILTQSKQVDINQIVAKDTLAEGASPYSNFAQVSISNFELIIDFYQLQPTPGRNPPVSAVQVHRVLIPLSLGKGLATAMANVIASYEAENNVVIPNGREPDPTDKIKIWP